MDNQLTITINIANYVWLTKGIIFSIILVILGSTMINNNDNVKPIIN